MGKVVLVGAGPGDPGLLTVRGLSYIRSADVIVYDRLVHQDILKEARADAELIYVGKSPGSHQISQDEINSILIQKALEHSIVVRLKGGDPFVFGRGGEEALALAGAGIEFEVVPGVTSAIAAPAYAGIPVTHRGLCSSLGIITGHEDPSKHESTLRWDKIATGLDTVVFLMGIENLQQIVTQMIAHGRSPYTPVAVIQWGTHSIQKTVTGTLADIVERINSSRLGPPAVAIVGDVVHLREELRWFDTKPLFGKRILVTRSDIQAAEFSELLRCYGAEAVEFPVIKISPPSDYAPLDTVLEKISGYDWLLFTSANGVRATLERLKATGRDVRALAGPKIGAIGPATAETLENAGIRVNYVPGKFVAEALIDEFPENPSGKRILIIRSETARNVLPETLANRGATVNVVAAYKTEVNRMLESVDEIRKQIESSQIDVATFTSSSTVTAFVEIMGNATISRMPESVKVACVGPITAQTAQEVGLRVDIVAEEYTIEGLVSAIASTLQNEQSD
ncbi:MAG: uroporphyrinogen-III C-methyltransferase [Armatimonadota bacterium]